MPRPARASRRRRSSSGSSSSARSARPGSSCDSSSIPGLRPPLGAVAPAMATLAAAPLDGTARQQDNLHLVGRRAGVGPAPPPRGGRRHGRRVPARRTLAVRRCRARRPAGLWTGPAAVGRSEEAGMEGAGQGGRRGWTRAVAGADVLAATGYLLLSFPLGLFWFTVLVTGLSVGTSLLVIWVGLPVLAATMMAARAGGRAERGRLRDSLGIDLPEAYRPLPSGSLLSRWSARMTDPAVWRDVAYLLLLLPLGTLWFTLVLVIWSLPLALVTMPLWYRLPPEGRSPLFDFDGRPLLVVDSLPEALAGVAIGLLLGLLAATLVRSLGMAHAVVARTLLSPGPAALRARVQTLETTRARVVEAAAEERRRIERDLHDGAQQRLVALAMDLGMAMEKFASEPEAARALVEEAHQEAKRALAELRDLARGIHPAVLSDRGLDAALSALAARSPVPVEVRVTLDGRLPAPVEAIAYFVAAEALVNVAKHAAAAATLTVTRSGDLAVVEVSDDGVGGAEAAAGSGLAGLADRVAGVDGRLTVASPPGGPTVV